MVDTTEEDEYIEEQIMDTIEKSKEVEASVALLHNLEDSLMKSEKLIVNYKEDIAMEVEKMKGLIRRLIHEELNIDKLETKIQSLKEKIQDENKP